MHTVMGRSGHRLVGEKAEVFRSALRTSDGEPWSRLGWLRLQNGFLLLES